MPGVQRYEHFIKTARARGPAAFLADGHPYLFFPVLPELAGGALFTTLKFNLREAQTADPLGRAVIPVKKGESNHFGMMITLGRADNNDLIIPDGRISKFHAYFRRLGDRWLITDANSTNGTTINGIRLAPERSLELSSGASLSFGALDAVWLSPEDLWKQLSAETEVTPPPPSAAHP